MAAIHVAVDASIVRLVTINTAMRYHELTEATRGIRVYHGSAHDHDRFDLSGIGTGEGFQAKGWGLYFAENRAVAQFYGDMLGRPRAGRDEHVGIIYEINLMAPKAHFLDLEMPLRRQPYIQTAVKDVELDPKKYTKLNQLPNGQWSWEGHYHQFYSPQDAQRLWVSVASLNGQGVYGRLSARIGGDRATSELLASKGIPGLRYLDEGSRELGRGTHNYVVWDTSIIRIVRKIPVASVLAA